MSTEGLGIKKTLEILNIGGPMTPSRISAEEQLICWACSQAIVQASSGNPVAATMILESLVDSMRGGVCEFSEEALKKDDEWGKLFAEDYQKAKDHITSSMVRTFYGWGGTSCSFQDLVRFDGGDNK